ncbi:radical SAM protein with 4Fe4S-binding SPASM domain [Hymenobacter luteus]|uniref:Radical SAM protein with 4Fe4S-binding SPASM domain n=2 Tax=Hymenobacter TaxID=89966 RepID=A0A7W9SYJ4_9BACT|nr:MULTISPECIES: SPASM domain-containing protein [Hymenobacter]MBB4599419.1 radical SAM protein with 4Fe4S-binding SPASM domain [Hymenobacter latericoloratus]MBB6058272.1 radical SAM protein with 4Fe4S-binding SPASM domain [Hymenobacter luteus]
MASLLTDGLNFFSKATPGRLWNGAQVVGGYVLSKLTGKARHWGLPVALSFEPTTSCNLRCPECPSGLRSFTRPTGMLPDELFRKTIDEVASRLWYLIFYFQGEPYLHPNFLDLVQYAARKGIYTATSTNAHYLNDKNARRTVESGLDRLIISLDGTTQDVYQQYRVGGKLDKVLEGTRNVIKWRRELKSQTPRVVFQFLVVRPNEHQIEDAKRLAKELGVDDVWFKTAQIYDYQNGSPLIPTIDYYSRYENNAADGTWSIKNKLVNHCWKMWHSCVITWDGLVVPCCFDKDAEYRLGDLKTQTFRQLWHGSKYQRFRASLLKGRDQIEMCRNCTEGTKVWG